jgi:signal transduction histidine kinase
VSRLADDIYELSRLESQTLRLNLRPVPVAAAVDAALSSLAHAAGVVVTIDDTLAALADARRLEQVVANLVENALVYGAAPVEVSARATGGGVCLTVVDSGPGVPEALVDNLFSGAGAPGPARAGVGLFLVRGLTEAMGGRVEYEARPAATGGGSIFRVHLLHPTRH